jgi:hypothetical protein
VLLLYAEMWWSGGEVFGSACDLNCCLMIVDALQSVVV